LADVKKNVCGVLNALSKIMQMKPKDLLSNSHPHLINILPLIFDIFPLTNP